MTEKEAERKCTPMEPPPTRWTPTQGQPTKVRLWPVIRDVLIILVLTFVVGFGGGFVEGFFRLKLPLLVFGLLNIGVVTIGFVISGLLAPATGRWTHLWLVAMGVWLFGLINVAISFITVMQWEASLAAILIAMGIGGGVSSLFKKHR